MTRILALALVLLFVPAAYARDSGAVEACRAYALKEAGREGMTGVEVVLERDGALALERYSRRIGKQPVSAILTGNGAVVMPGSPSAELSFLCLLGEGGQPVFFNWLPRQNVAALAQCRRDEQVRAQARSCLELLLRTAEMDLGTVYAHRFQEANARGEPLLAAYRKSNEEWREYREAECARRRGTAPAGVAPEEAHLACMVELTRRRALDMR